VIDFDGQAVIVTGAGLDAVVSNAGIFNTQPFDELSLDEWRRMLDVHLNGSLRRRWPSTMNPRSVPATSGIAASTA
jgi:NAD(P)-dependent dehydrogenase (short-subunit alcohol dehydrogenase family)